jgi:hypothetical protein
MQQLLVGHKRTTGSRSLWSMVSGTPPSSSTDDYNSQKMDRSSENRTDIQMPARQEFVRPRERDCDRQVAQLLNCPNGAVLNASTWLKAEACAQEAAEEGDFNLAFEILDRMAQDPNSASEMNNEAVYAVVQLWVSAYDRYQKSPRGAISNYMYSPGTVWRKIESYLQMGIQLESRTLHRVLEATSLVKSKKLNAPVLAESILERMISLSKQQNPDIRPSFYTFNAVIAAWEAAATLSSNKSQLTLKEAPERGMMLLERLKALHAADGGSDLMPDKNTYRRVMNLFAHKGDGDQVEELLQELYESYLEHGHKNLLPTTPMFSLVLYAWSKSKDPTAAERAQIILDHMLEMERNNEFPGLKVTAFCFNIVMVCWSKQRTRESAQKAQTLFDSMLALSASDPTKRPIPGSYAALVTTWSFWDPKKSEEALWMWKREHNAGNCDMRMDNKLFSTLIAGWFYSKDPNSAKRCDKLLQYGLEGNFGEAWQPNVADFNMTINAYCRRKNIQDTERAEALLVQMKDLAKSSKDFRGPSVSSYIPVIHNLTRLRRVEKAEILLREWFDRDNSQSDGDHDTSELASKKKNLNTKTFNRVLKAWLSKAPVAPEAADRAEDLLLNMNDWGIRPNMASFQYTLECRKRIRKEHNIGLEKSDVAPRVKRILSLLDREYETGSLSADQSAYLTTRRDWALITCTM